ncbi:hypothetical protein ACH5RR_026812 [Cinchona calisaya]|uniref:F-box domain-containing protein n=1 Tax=Cinchona calisaya TaxID=153742 RepID=A0ABD2Z710_9GENT
MGKGGKVSSCSQLKKCPNSRRTPEDQISQVPVDRTSLLPDEVLVFILSLLTINEAAQTSVLSSRWKNLWKYTPRLDFDAPKAMAGIARKRELLESERCKYVNWVNRVMQLHEGLTLDEFRLCFDLDISSQKEIDRWLEYAFRRGVKWLELNLLIHGTFSQNFSRCYDFPDYLLNLINGLSKEQLHLDYSTVTHPKLVEFSSLRALCLKGVNVTGEVIESFLHNCPLLERLVVVGSGKLVNLLVSGSSLMLKHLEIQFCHNAKSIKISDCNLVFLGMCEAENLELMNLPMLSEVFVSGKSPNFWRHVFLQLSRFRSQLETLKLEDSEPENIMTLRDFAQLCQLKELLIRTYAFDDNSLMRLTFLIKACPFLRKFGLQLLWWEPVKINRENEKGAKCTLKHLREIELAGYYGRTSDVELLMYFIENAVALEKIIINPRSQVKSQLPLPIRRTKVQMAAVTTALKEVEQLLGSRINKQELKYKVSNFMGKRGKVSSCCRLHKLSRGCSQLETLKVKDCEPENIIMCRDFPQLSQLKELMIGTGAMDDDSHGIDFLDKGLSTLAQICVAVDFICECVNCLQLLWVDPVKINRENEKGAKCALKHLREIELAGYYGHTSDVELLMYFIENAVALEKIVINPRCQLQFQFPLRIRRTKVEMAAVTIALKGG